MNRNLRRLDGYIHDISIGKDLKASRQLNFFLVFIVMLHYVSQLDSFYRYGAGTLVLAINGTKRQRDSSSRQSFVLEASEQDDVTIKRIYLLGERNSGTNYLEKVLKQSYFLNYSDPIDFPVEGRSELGRKMQARWKQKYPYAYGSPVFEFKHMFRQSVLTESEVQSIKADENSLWILAIRSPCEWADAMYRKPWHLCPMDSTLGCKEAYVGMGDIGNQSRVEFFQSPWNDHVEANLTPDNDYTMHANVFDLRSFKLRLMAQVAGAVPRRVYVTHLNQVEKSPRAFIDALAKLYGLTPSLWFPENSQSPIRHGPVCFDSDEYNVAQSSLDWDLEGFFGFSPLDCHVCSLK